MVGQGEHSTEMVGKTRGGAGVNGKACDLFNNFEKIMNVRHEHIFS